MRRIGLLILTMLAGCAAPGGPYPSLQPRAAEMVDPRVPVNRPVNDRPANPALLAKLAGLTRQAQAGDAAFAAAIARAEQLVASSGAPRSEGWIAAQEALSAAIAERAPTARAVADIDALAADALEVQRGLAPNDREAIERAAAEAAAVDQRQVDRISAVQRRLGI